MNHTKNTQELMLPFLRESVTTCTFMKIHLSLKGFWMYTGVLIRLRWEPQPSGTFTHIHTRTHSPINTHRLLSAIMFHSTVGAVTSYAPTREKQEHLIMR